ncbi:hypothetical protein AXG93_1513s1080 [Marchantia polymorpha subsp. ruderalis]|uniref:Uncharacterized protein n=1 Tax=Marchantia polymorpha subsp. ruderalis TaxID=1480154 RepID=A0A176WBM2_MARPO|nr:hypothetical protein AXG93_1513s1080 [Marchantia polymorpha subsp. ruderalis]
MADIINIVKTWDHESNTIGEIPWFTLVRSTLNHRSQRAGRGYGGSATFIRSQFLPLIHLEGQDIGASGQLIELLKDTASKFFLRHKDRRARGLPCNGWFDLDCKQARMRSVDKSLDFQSRLILTRLYKDLVKSKKRAFLSTKQESLTKELMENPKSFSIRLVVWSSKPTLDPKSLIDFAEKLYFFPNAASMPCCEGTSGLFSESEVMTQVRKLANGKSEDLDGLSIELLKWGGDVIGPILTKALENAAMYGFPSTWSLRKIVPIHKSGRKDLVTNYRTIMVSSVFAKANWWSQS